ncbi:MAG: thiolase family protein [Propionibacteriales bacterium]|nr:thiolase family protein [Propionibacteriales bacterium]
MRSRNHREAVIAGAATTPLGRLNTGSSLPLMAAAASDALSEAGLDWSKVDGLITCTSRTDGWSNPVEALAHYLSMQPSYLANIDLAGASGVAMVHHAVMAVEHGLAETVVVLGGQDLLTRTSGPRVVEQLAQNGPMHPEFEAGHEALLPTTYALITDMHMRRFGTTRQQLACIARDIRAHASLNPNAFKRELLTLEEILSSPVVSDPLHKLDCSVIADGAAAVVVTSSERASASHEVGILGVGYGTRHAWIGDAEDPTSCGAVESGVAAFRMAGLQPKDIDVLELYDCFTIAVLILLEDLGFCDKGEAGAMVAEQGIGPGSRLPVTTHGGLLSAGHPGVAGGLFHVVEGIHQLHGVAGERQVQGAKTALVHGIGGVMGTHATLLLGSGETHR